MNRSHHSPVRLLLAMLGGLLPAVAGAFDVETVPLVDSRSADVAYNPVDDEYLIVWQSAGRNIRGQVRRSDGTLVADLNLLLGSSSRKFTSPRVTFKSGQNHYVVVAHELDTSAPLPFEAITLAAFNRLGVRQWIRNAGAAVASIRNPVVVADTFSTSCCLLVVWEESFGSIRAQRLNADGTQVAAAFDIFSGGSEFPPHAMNPAVTYQRTPGDVFLVAYQAVGPSRVAVKRVPAVSGAPSAEIIVGSLAEAPQTSRGLRFLAGVAVTYNATAQRYLVAWGDSGTVYARRLTTAAAVLGTAPRSLSTSAGTPSATSAPGDVRDVVTLGRLYPSVGYWMEASDIDDLTAPLSYWRLSVARPKQSTLSATACSPTSRSCLHVWQDEELSSMTSDVVGTLHTLAPLP